MSLRHVQAAGKRQNFRVSSELLAHLWTLPWTAFLDLVAVPLGSLPLTLPHLFPSRSQWIHPSVCRPFQSFQSIYLSLPPSSLSLSLLLSHLSLSCLSSFSQLSLISLTVVSHLSLVFCRNSLVLFSPNFLSSPLFGKAQSMRHARFDPPTKVPQQSAHEGSFSLFSALQGLHETSHGNATQAVRLHMICFHTYSLCPALVLPLHVPFYEIASEIGLQKSLKSDSKVTKTVKKVTLGSQLWQTTRNKRVRSNHIFWYSLILRQFPMRAFRGNQLQMASESFFVLFLCVSPSLPLVLLGNAHDSTLVALQDSATFPRCHPLQAKEDIAVGVLWSSCEDLTQSFPPKQGVSW